MLASLISKLMSERVYDPGSQRFHKHDAFMRAGFMAAIAHDAFLGSKSGQLLILLIAHWEALYPSSD